MKRCVKCLRPDTLPGCVFNAEGVCPACERFEARKNIPWEARQEFLHNLCNEHRATNGSYDCIIPVSGGKDSFYQVNMFKNKYRMNPLLVTVTDPFYHTEEGTHNFKQIGKAFDCDHITLALDPNFVKKTSIYGLDKLGSTNWAVDKAIYAFPLQEAIRRNIKLIVYGENVGWEYGGVNGEDTWDANKQIFNDVVKPEGESMIDELDPLGTKSNCLKYPTEEELKAHKIQAIYTSFFYPWNDLVNVEVAEQNGFQRLKGWKREGFIDDYTQIDSRGYLFNYYLKFMKYGIGRVVDIGSRWVRYGKITKEELQQEISLNEGALDHAILTDFCDTVGMTVEEITKKMKKWWNTDVFTLDDQEWEWKDQQ